MRRELKDYFELLASVADEIGRKAHPDEKGTERYFGGTFSIMPRWVAKHIPMRRELKEQIPSTDL